MKLFTNKGIGKKIIIAILIILLFQVVMMKPVHADVVQFGGKLLSPMMSLFVSLGDGLNDIISSSIMGNTTTLVNVDMEDSFWDYLATFVVAIVAAVAIIAVIVGTMGLASLAAAAVGITATAVIGTGTIIAGIAGGVIAGAWYAAENMPEDLYLPIYTYSAEEIFKDNILLFNIDFFGSEKVMYARLSDGSEVRYRSEEELTEELSNHVTVETKTITTPNPAGGAATTQQIEVKKNATVEYYYYKDEKGKEVKTSKQDMAATLKRTISSWYNALRNICIVLMLSILVYIGIRMLLSSVASDKAKYVTMLKDWFIGLCLLFLMHYIMAFSVTLVGKLTDVVKTSVGANGYAIVMEDEDGEDGPLCEAVRELGQEETISSSGGKTYVTWPTNLMGALRLQLQMEDYGAAYIGYGICFLILCLFTFYFTVIYLKRVLHMAFLTLIAPLVALTYCIDKINDGSAQGFDKWLKEYIFNLLIQPLHLLLYYILVTSAFELAGQNVIYSIVALGFMIPAEKLLRGFFGFEKASTAPALGPAGAMMASTALNNILNKNKKGAAGKGDGKGNGDEDDSDRVPNPREADPVGMMLGNESDGQQQEDSTINMTDMPDDTQSAPLPTNQQTPQSNTNTMGNNQTNSGIILPQSVRQDQQQQGAREQREREAQEQQARQTATVSKPKRRITGALGNAGGRMSRAFKSNLAANKAAIRMMPGKLKEKIENAHPAKALGKVAAGAMLGGTAAMAGMAIAATTGDASNVAKIGLAAGATGYAVGAGNVDRIKSPMEDPKIKGTYNDTYNSPEYDELAMSEYVKKYLKDARKRNYLEQRFGKDQAKKMLRKGGDVETYLNNDISDIKEIAAIQKLRQEGVVNNINEGIAISQFGGMIGSDTNKMNQKSRDDWRNRIQKMAEKNKGVKDAKGFADDRMTQIDRLNDIKSKL